MSKYSSEFKLKVIKYYLEEKHSYSECMKKFNVPTKSMLNNWIHKYETHGVEGIMKQLKSSYNGNFKQDVVEYMHNNHLSLQETAIHFNLAGDWIVSKWERIY